MMLELIQEVRPETGTMYAVVRDGMNVKWFANLDAAESFYNAVVSDPTVLENKRNILKSQEVVVSLDINNTENNN